MIREFKNGDIEEVMTIWLNANMEAHSFIDPQYWKDNFDAVKEMLPQAEIYVSENHHMVDGFIGLTGDYIAGLFVDRQARAKGIGSELLDYARKNREKLNLQVYKKNTPAVKFYLSRDFKVDVETLDAQTGEAEYNMIWEKPLLYFC